MRLNTLCAAAGIECPAEWQNDEVRSIETDSRRVTQDCLFVCLRGLHTDGHLFAKAAAEAGARWILCETEYRIEDPTGVTYLKVADTRRALADLYSVWYGDGWRDLCIIGVTGTNGKSSVSSMIATILNDAGCSCGLIGTLGCYLNGRKMEVETEDPLANMTTPDPAQLYRVLNQMADAGARYVAMEVSSHALALQKVAPIRFAMGVFTNLTPEHLDFHESMEHYARAKAKLMEQSACVIVNLDANGARQMLQAAKARKRTCSMSEPADYRAKEIELRGGAGIAYRMLAPARSLWIESPIPGRFNVMNTMQAAAVAMELGIGSDTVCSSLAKAAGVKGRMERVPLPADAEFTVLIDYAHTPDAMKNLLQTAREMAKARIVLLFGCGGDRDRTKRPVMGRIASAYADRVILTSDNSRTEDKGRIIREIRAGFPDSYCSYEIVDDRRRAIRQAILTAQQGDLILLAGKGHEEYEIDAGERRYFSEIEIVKDAYALREKIKQQDGGALP